MRIIKGIGLSPDISSPERIEALKRIAPQEWWSEGDLGIGLPESDPRSAQVLALLHGWGLRPWDALRGERQQGKEYRALRKRKYGQADLESCRYLTLSAAVHIHGNSRIMEGKLTLDPFYLPNEAVFVSPDIGGIVVPDTIRRALATANLHGVTFRPTLLLDARDDSPDFIPWEKFGSPWWELTTNVRLPPTAPSMDRRDYRGNPVPRDYTGMVGLRDGNYDDLELHYVHDELAAVEPFDLATSFEQWGGDEARRWLIASSRFYRCCAQHEFKANWVPVRLE